jgi:colanic acid biosynthesis glycosyl transferase WcaI
MQATADAGLVTLLPGTGESSVPSKILGYMASGRAVVASVRGDSPTAQTIREADCGIVVPPQDPAALAAAICTLADDRELAARFGRNAHAYFLANFSRARCAQQFKEMMLK